MIFRRKLIEILNSLLGGDKNLYVGPLFAVLDSIIFMKTHQMTSNKCLYSFCYKTEIPKYWLIESKETQTKENLIKL